MTGPSHNQTSRTYSGRLAALIVLAVVVVFVLLNVVTGHFVPQPAKPVQPPTVTERPTR
ncbi:MAG: hypothetical protein ABI912_12640 [Actinomycetota bacterium]